MATCGQKLSLTHRVDRRARKKHTALSCVHARLHYTHSVMYSVHTHACILEKARAHNLSISFNLSCYLTLLLALSSAPSFGHSLALITHSGDTGLRQRQNTTNRSNGSVNFSRMFRFCVARWTTKYNSLCQIYTDSCRLYNLPLPGNTRFSDCFSKDAHSNTSSRECDLE